MLYKKFVISFYFINLYSFIEVPLSVADFLDKHSILTIKIEQIIDAEKQKNILYELSSLEDIFKDIIANQELVKLYILLVNINKELWNIESQKRACEAAGIKAIILKVKNNEPLTSDEHKLLITFLYLARQVYIQNDERARIKKEINTISGSDIIEEKSHF